MIWNQTIFGTINGNHFYCGFSARCGFMISYTNTQGESKGYWPCEEDEEVLFGLYAYAITGGKSEQEVCEMIADTMRQWDYDI